MSKVAGAALTVTASKDEARRLVAAGSHVVLIVAPADSGPAARELSGGPGRVLLMVGEVTEPSVRQAAEEMAVEMGARLGST